MKRPWGVMYKLIHTKRFWLKLIKVHGRTSLQSHKQRSEYWIGITKIKKNVKHRLLPGWYIELAFGSPKEEDIIRYEDDYGRK